MNKKVIFGVFIALTLSLSACSKSPEKKEDEEAKTEWNIGKVNATDVKAEYKDGLLHVSGRGEMMDFAQAKDTPWFSYGKDIKNIKVDEGVTSFGANAFVNIPVDKIIIPASVLSVSSDSINDETIIYRYESDLELDLYFEPTVYYHSEHAPRKDITYWQSDFSKTDITANIDDDEDEKEYWKFDNDNIVHYEKKKVLFIGNSFTYRNGVIDFSSGVPGIFDEVAKDLDYYVETYSITGPGWYLDNHAKATDTCGKQVDMLLKKVSDFDFIVLQEQSVTPFENYNRFLSGVTALKTKIEQTQTKAKIYLYETWGSPYSADERKITVQEMERKLREAYTNAGEALDLDVTYVGRAFTDVYVHHPEIYLWASDNRHQGYTGAYLSGCTHTAHMLGADVTKTTFVNNPAFSAPALSEDVLKVLRQAAYDSAHDIIHDEEDPEPPVDNKPHKDLEIAVWGRWITNAQMETVYEAFEEYCKTNSITLGDAGFTYYVGATNSEQYFYIATFSAAAKASEADIVFPCATNLNTQDGSAYVGDNPTITALNVTLNGKTDRCVAKFNENVLTNAFYNFVLSDEGKAAITGEPVNPPEPPAPQERTLEIAVWGRWIKEDQMASLFTSFTTWCTDNSISIEGAHYTYYAGQSNTDTYYYIKAFSEAAKPTNPDIIFPCATNINDNADSAFNGDEMLLGKLNATLNGRDDRYVAKVTDNELALTFYNYLLSATGKEVLEAL